MRYYHYYYPNIYDNRILLIPLLLLFRNCCTILALPMYSEIIDGFWHSRCLNECIDLFYMIGLFASGAHASLVAKYGTKEIIPLLSIKSSQVDRFQSFRCINDHIDLPYMMGSLTSGATNSLVAEIGTKYLATSCSVYRFSTNGQICCSR